MKRFKLTATGKVKRGHSMKRHILTKKAAGRKRGLRKSTLVSEAETPGGAPDAAGVESALVRQRLRGAALLSGAVVALPGLRRRLEA